MERRWCISELYGIVVFFFLGRHAGLPLRFVFSGQTHRSAPTVCGITYYVLLCAHFVRFVLLSILFGQTRRSAPTGCCCFGQTHRSAPTGCCFWADTPVSPYGLVFSGRHAGLPLRVGVFGQTRRSAPTVCGYWQYSSSSGQWIGFSMI